MVMKHNTLEFSRHSARQITKEDLNTFHYIITMERYNNTNILIPLDFFIVLFFQNPELLFSEPILLSRLYKYDSCNDSYTK